MKGARFQPSGGIALLACGLTLACVAVADREAPRSVRNDEELRTALDELRPGSELVIAPGHYAGGRYLEKVQGTSRRPILIRAADPTQPPIFAGGGSQAWHLSDCSHLVLRDLVVRGFAGNGINVDDGGSYETPSVGIRIEGVRIENTGPQGNHDALKMSGVDAFVVKDCHFLNWGGSAVDLVGCHDGVIELSEFQSASPFTAASGIQIKGGSARITVQSCSFRDAGARAINAGGSTGLAYFRPLDATAEAHAITIRSCEFSGGETPLAAVGVVGLRMESCTIRFPQKWLLRILQESRDERFQPCQDGILEGNVFHFDHSLRSLVNVGPGTLPESFLFRDNRWIEYGPDREPLAEARQPVWPPQ